MLEGDRWETLSFWRAAEHLLASSCWPPVHTPQLHDLRQEIWKAFEKAQKGKKTGVKSLTPFCSTIHRTRQQYTRKYFCSHASFCDDGSASDLVITSFDEHRIMRKNTLLFVIDWCNEHLCITWYSHTWYNHAHRALLLLPYRVQFAKVNAMPLFKGFFFFLTNISIDSNNVTA